MKIAVWALIIVGIYFVYQLTAGKVFRDYQNCYDVATLDIASLNPPENQVCVMQKLSYEQLNACVKTIQQSNNMAGFLYQAAPVKKNIEADIAAHNEKCIVNKIDPPKQSFYLSAGAKR